MEPSLLRHQEGPRKLKPTPKRGVISTFSTSLVTLGILESPESPSVDPSNLGSDRGHARLIVSPMTRGHG